MKKFYLLLIILSVLFSPIKVSAQAASITWPLTVGINPNTPVGNIQGTAESIGVGPIPTMSISSLFPYGVNGQQLWVGNTGWIVGPLDLTRFIQFDATPTSGNVLTVTDVSFNYGDYTLATNLNFLSSQVFYSTDNWTTAGIQLSSNVLNYLNTNMQSFTATGLNVLVNNSQTFSLRIYPYAVKTGLGMNPTYAIHNSVVISGTTAAQVVNGSICGKKFNDLNGDGIQNNGEPGLQGWTINMSYSGAAGPITVSTITGADGSYCFNDVAAGKYTVSETQKSGWTQTYPAAPGNYSVTLTAGQNLLSQNFGNQQLLGSICGMKFNDLNGNGVKDPGESGLSNWTINLTYNNAAGPVTLTTTTDAKGNYCFSNLLAGPYTLSESQKSGWTQTYPAAPGTYSINITAGQNLLGQNFGNQQLLGSICGMKFNDLNGNGIQDANETGLSGWTISLTYNNAAGPVTVTTTTDANGNYCFNNLTDGSYAVSETQKSGWTQTFPAAPGTYSIRLSLGQNLLGQNFGNQQLLGSICGMKFNDLNGNGIKDAGESGLSSWTISLTSNNAAGIPVTSNLSTEPDGTYCFYNLIANTYTVSETQKSGWTQTLPLAPGKYTVNLTAGQNVINQNFGNHFCIPSITGSTLGSTCGTGTVVLGATASGGTINWYDTLTGGSSLGTGVTFTTPGISFSTTYYVDATDACGTTSVRTAVVATCYPLPIVSAPASVAVGSTITLSPTTGGTWVSNSPLIASVTNEGVVTGVSAGSATFTFTNAINGCSATTSSVTVGSDCIFLCNTDFEISSPHPSQYNWIPQANVPCWHTTGSLGEIEIWKSGYQGFPAYTGIQFAELNAQQVGTFYQTFTAISGTAVNISFAHMGRYAGLDKMEVQIGPDGGPYQTIGTYYDNNTGWTLYSVTHTFLSSGLYQLRFASIYSNGGGASNVLDGGNFLDAITINCLKPSDATVNPGGPDQICQSANPSAITLSGAIVGGSATTGAWSIVSGGGTLSSTAQTASPASVTYTPPANFSGTVILKLTTNSSPAISATRTITINALPPAPATITGGFSLCVGSTTQLADATSGGIWTSSSAGVATVNASTGLVTGVSTGTTLITYTTASPVTVCTNSVTQIVTVNAVPTISGNTPASRCGTGTVTLGATASAGTINWYAALTGGVSLGTGTTFTTPGISTTTTYYVDATSGGCTTGARTAVVATVNALPIVSAPVSVAVGSTITLSPPTGGTWTSSNPLVATVTNAGVVTGVSTGTATFTFTNTITGCSASTALVTVTAKLSTCDLLSATATKVTPGDCIWNLSLNQPANLIGVSSIQVLTLSPNQMTVGTALVSPYNTWFYSGTLATGLTFTPSNGTVPGGNLTNFLTLNLSYVTSPQTVIVNWLNDLGGAVCSDTLQLNCQPTCVSILSQRVACVGNKYNLAYLFTNNATYGIHTIDYTVQSPANVTITPASVILSPDIASYSTSALQNILLSGALPGDQVSIIAKFMSPDGCCWCFETLNVTIPTCGTVCDSLIVSAQGTPEDCCYSISLTNTSATVFSNIEFELLSGGIFGTMSASSSGWGFTNIAPNNLLNLVKLPLSQGIGTGTFNNVLDLCIRQYSSPTQVVEVRWMNHGKVICRDTLRFECIKVPPVTDDCSQITGGILTCLPNGTFQYEFRVQNNSNINSTGFKINPTTPGVIFSQTDFPNTPILTGTLSPLQSIIVSGIGQGQNVCFQLTIFKTIAGAGTLVYSDCCHSEPMCITTPQCDIKLGSICGTKFNDLNANGVRDARGYGEPGLPKWTISLTGSTTMSATTDENGNYCFHDLPAGTYTVSEVMQPGWEQTLPLSPGTYTITITSGQVLTNINFGNTYDPCILGLKAWSALKTGIDGTVYALAVMGTDVYVGGSFSSIGDLAVNNIAKWDGQNWSALGTGVNDGVHALAVVGTQLYVGGQFSAASGVSGTKYIAKWNGSAWSPVGSGINGIVISFAVIATDLYAGGSSGVNYISKWNGTSWSVIGSGMNGSVAALAALGTNLYAGGDFTTAGGNVVGHVAKWNGTAWSKPGNGINTDVFALATIGSNLYASGYFNDAGGVPAKHIAKWDGLNWSALGTGVDNYVEAFAVNGTDLYAGGSFTNAGGINANRVAKWDGASWTPLGAGINGIYVKALAITDRTLYAGGWFTDAGGEMNTQNIAKYACLDEPLLPGTICGMKFNDLNGNGRKDDGELGLANWTIILSGIVEKKVTTDKEGNYCFSDIVPGKYEISEVNQNGWLQTAPYPETYTIVVEPGQHLTGINFGNRVDQTSQVGSICGMKFNDLNGNGKLDEGERGIPNWTIILSGSADRKIQTDGKGYFCFTQLKPGKYEVSEVNQDNWLQTSPYPGSYTFILDSGRSLENINFGNRVDVTAKVGSICGMKYNDLNGNGRKDEGELGLPNWTILLSGQTHMEATTDRYGNFCFFNLTPGKYEVSEVNQNGWRQTAPYTLTYSFILESGQNLTAINFGNKTEKDIKVGSICGMKFNDLNGNGIMDKDESGLPNWTILLSGETNRGEATTDRYGNFCFTDLVPGKYELSEVNQNGWLQTAPTTSTFMLALDSGQNLTAINFGNRADKEAKVGSICGMKFNDLNGNGTMDRDEPGLPNWTIILSGTAHREATTDKYGNYCFYDLVPGKYEISEVNQLRWKQTAPSTGTYSLELASGQNVGDRNFGNRSILTLISPAEDETLQEGKTILFTWLPPVPVPTSYKIKIVEILGDQSPEEAISKNTAFFETGEIFFTSYTYPVSAMKLAQGRKYAWQIGTNGPVENMSKASSFALRSPDEPVKVSVMLQQPPFNQLKAEDLWKAIIENTTYNTLNIKLFGTIELAGEGIVSEGESFLMNLAPGEKGINFENFQSRIEMSIFDRWGNLIFGDGDYTMCLQVKDESGNELGRGCLQQRVELTTFVIGYLLQQGFNLGQNHPNPFSTMTTIGYEIPKAAMVQIRIYDILGKQISLLVNEQKSAGRHEIIFDRKGLVSGIYYYSITTGGLSQTRKMILTTF